MNFVHLLRSFTNPTSAQKGRIVHAMLITSGMSPDIYTYNHLITMYCKTSRIKDARQVFDKMPQRNLISWTTLISSYSHTNMSVEALDCFRLMVDNGSVPNHYTYVSALSASATLRVSRTGKEIHTRIVKCGEKLNSFVENSLVNFYGKCGMLRDAMVVFDTILDPNEVSWTSLVSCACQCGENHEGLKIFSRSHQAGVKVNEFACASVLGACSATENMKLGLQVHCYAVKSGTRLDQFVVTGLVNLYSKCGHLDSGQRAFDEVNDPHLTSWTALIGGYVQNGKNKEAINLFCRLNDSGNKPNERTFATVLVAAVNIEIGKQLHSLILKFGYLSFTFVGNSIMDFYFKSANFTEALNVFEEMNEHDVVTWNTLIAGHMNLGYYEKAVEFLREMLTEGYELNLHSYSSILTICGDLPAIEWGKQTHCSIIKLKFDTNVVVGSTLIDMYAKCGRLKNARNIFENFHFKNIVSWNAMLVGYANNGEGEKALEIYNKMLNSGVKPNAITFIGVLSACGHSGLLQDGLYHFSSMSKDYGIAPRTDHLACMVNLFSRKGQTKLAYDFINRNSLSMKPDKVVWRCLLSGCKINKDFELGKYAAEKILSIDPDDVSAYIMLSNIYAELKLWNDLANIRKVLREKVLKKDTGFSWIELTNKTYLFSSGQDSGFEGNCVFEILKGLTKHLFDEGYVPMV